MGCTGCSCLLHSELQIDARGQKCPLPVLRLEKALSQRAGPATITLVATDPVARIDVPLLCRQRGFDFTLSETETVLTFVITVPAPPR